MLMTLLSGALWSSSSMGRRCWSRRIYEAAVEAFSNAIDLNPAVARFYHRRGWAHVLRDDIKNALVDKTQAITLDPDNYNYIASRGSVYWRAGDTTAAIEDYHQAVGLFEESNVPIAWVESGRPWNAAWLYRETRKQSHAVRGSFDLAISDLQRALEFDPDNASYWAELGNTYIDHAGDYEQALVHVERAIELESIPR